MKWTYDKVRRYAEVQRKRAGRRGCQKCGKKGIALELAGSPPLSRLTRDGYGIARVKMAMLVRGWFCRGCARGLLRKQEDRNQEVSDAQRGKKKQKQQQFPEPVLLDKRDWPDDKKWEYVYAVYDDSDDETTQAALDSHQGGRAREVWTGAELEIALRIIHAPY